MTSFRLTSITHKCISKDRSVSKKEQQSLQVHKRQKVTAIPLFYYKVNKEKLTEYNFAVEANTSSEAGTSSEEK